MSVILIIIVLMLSIIIGTKSGSKSDNSTISGGKLIPKGEQNAKIRFFSREQ